MSVINNLRLRESVGVVTHQNGVEFFKANVRDSVSLKMDFPDISNLLKCFDGKTSIQKIAENYGSIDIHQLTELARYLKEQFVLIEQDVAYPADIIQRDIRLVNLLEDYFQSTSGVLSAIKRLENATVMIIGLGAVGSFLAIYLAKSNVGNLILVDNDQVDLSNLHRQCYFESDIGLNKAEVLKENLKTINADINITIIPKFLTEDFFEDNSIPSNLNLIVNCSDEPSVDITSQIISKYSMQHTVPHIVGGGYNLHLTLVGQTIIPFQSACFLCFKTALSKINNKDLGNVKALHRENRKLGSFAPLSGLSASLAALDAFKVLIGKYDTLQQVNKRIEFNVQNLQFQVTYIDRNTNCKWCGQCQNE